MLTDLGWVSFDPTNRVCATEAYIRTATGLDYAEAGPDPRRAQRRRGRDHDGESQFSKPDNSSEANNQEDT